MSVWPLFEVLAFCLAEVHGHGPVWNNRISSDFLTRTPLLKDTTDNTGSTNHRKYKFQEVTENSVDLSEEYTSAATYFEGQVTPETDILKSVGPSKVLNRHNLVQGAIPLSEVNVESRSVSHQYYPGLLPTTTDPSDGEISTEATADLQKNPEGTGTVEKTISTVTSGQFQEPLGDRLTDADESTHPMGATPVTPAEWSPQLQEGGPSLPQCLLLTDSDALPCSKSDGNWNWTDQNLPSDISPYHYNIKLKPNRYEDTPLNIKDTVHGQLQIFFRCNRSTQRIILHVNNIRMKDVTLRTGDIRGTEEVPSVMGYGYDHTKTAVRIDLSKPLQNNTDYILSVGQFRVTVLRSSRVGFINYDYTDVVNGTEVSR